MKDLVIPYALRDAWAPILAGIPSGHEACGFFLGHQDDECARVVTLLPVRNIRQRPGSFAVSQFEYRRAIRQARHRDLDLVALYHTHPTGPIRLSTSDRESIARSTVPWVVIARNAEADYPNADFQIVAFSAGTGAPLAVSWVERD